MLTHNDRRKKSICQYTLEHYFSNILDAPFSFMIISLYGPFPKLSVGQGTDNQPSLLTAAQFPQHREIRRPFAAFPIPSPEGKERVPVPPVSQRIIFAFFL